MNLGKWCTNEKKNFDSLKKGTVSILFICNVGLKVWGAPIIKKLFSEKGIKCSAFFCDYLDINDDIIEHYSKKCDYVLVWLPLKDLYPNLWLDLLLNDAGSDGLFERVKKGYSKILDLIEKYDFSLRAFVSLEDYSDNFNYCHCNFWEKEKISDWINGWIHEKYLHIFNIIDLKWLIAMVGIGQAFDYRLQAMTGFCYSPEVIKGVMGNIVKHYEVELCTPIKCIVLDCDNVLWGGILSEDGAEGIRVGSTGYGSPYYEFQKLLLTLYYQGIILAICTRNDFLDIVKVLDNHSGMLLKLKHFAFISADWNSKPERIKGIADQLGIGLKQLIFIDDSVSEVESVKYEIPEVTSIIFDPQNVYSELSCISVKTLNDIKSVEIRNKTYRDNIIRKKLQDSLNNNEAYLEHLQTKVVFERMTESELQRVAELSRRANRFTNGKRITVDELKTYLTDNEMYSIYISDCYGDLGLSGAVVLVNKVLVLVCMSCRAVGRNVEEKIVDFVKNNVKAMTMIKIDTGKNKPFLDLWSFLDDCDHFSHQDMHFAKE